MICNDRENTFPFNLLSFPNNAFVHLSSSLSTTYKIVYNTSWSRWDWDASKVGLNWSVSMSMSWSIELWSALAPHMCFFHPLYTLPSQSSRLRSLDRANQPRSYTRNLQWRRLWISSQHLRSSQDLVYFPTLAVHSARCRDRQEHKRFCIVWKHKEPHDL